MKRGVSGDQVLAAAVIAVVAFLLGLAASPVAVLDGIRHFPAPTPAWATIVTGLAWPVVAAILLLRFGEDLGGAVRTVVRRIATDRKVTLPGGTSFERETRESLDQDREALLDLIDDPSHRETLDRFIADLALKPAPTARNFVMRPLYRDQWAAARRRLEGR